MQSEFNQFANFMENISWVLDVGSGIRPACLQSSRTSAQEVVTHFDCVLSHKSKFRPTKNVVTSLVARKFLIFFVGLQLKCDGTRRRMGEGSEGETGEWSG